MTEKKTIRYIDTELRADKNVAKGMCVEGYALKFDKETTIRDQFGSYTESISRKAMEGANIDDVVLDFNHNWDNLLARTTNGTLKLEVDDVGLKISGTLADTSLGRDVYKMISDGLISRMSFEVEIGEDEWSKRDGIDHRELTKFKRFYDVSVVTFPAYEDTLISARSDIVISDELVKRHFNQTNDMNEKERTIMEENKNEVLETTPTEAPVELREDAPTEETPTSETPTDEKVVDPTEEVADELQALKDELRALKEEVEKPENSDTEEGEIKMSERKMDVENPKVTTGDIYATVEYRNAWFDAVRGNDMALRAMDTTAGEHVIPTMLADKIETALRQGGTIANLCSKMSVKGLYSIPVELTATGAVLGTEDGSEPTEEEITFGEVLMKPQLIHKWIGVTKEMESLAINDFASYLSDEIADKILVALDNQIISGAKTDGVQGITTADEKFVKSGVASDLSVAGFKAQAEIKCGGSATIVFNRAFYMSEIATLKDTTGNLLVQPVTTANGVVAYYNGMKVELVDNDKLASSAADTTKPAFICGVFANYQLNFPNGYGVELLRDPYTKAPNGLVRYNGDLLVGGAIKKMASFYVGKLA